jgi:hypothetical protein
METFDDVWEELSLRKGSKIREVMKRGEKRLAVQEVMTESSPLGLTAGVVDLDC